MAGCQSGPLLWPCVLYMMYLVAAVGILLWRGAFVVLVCEEGVRRLWCNGDVCNGEKRAVIKRVWLAVRGRTMNYKDAIIICI